MRNTKLESLTETQVNKLLKILEEKQKLLNEGEYLKISSSLLEIILFEDETKTNIRKEISLKGLDLSNISFSGADISEVDFTGSFGAKIDPQKIKDKNCRCVNFNGVELTGLFDGCLIYGARFQGSKGAKIDPQKIKDKDCRNVIFNNVEITGAFDGCAISGANFKGSIEAKINPETIKNKNFRYVNFEDAEIIGYFNDGKISGARFKGSKGAKIDPRELNMEDLSDIDFADVEFLDVIYKPNRICNTSFEGSKNAVINMQSSRYLKTVIYNTNLSDVKLIYDEDLDYDTKIPSINLFQKYQELIDGNNILSKTTTINGLGLSYFLKILKAQNKQFYSYLEELNKSPQPKLKRRLIQNNVKTFFKV